MGSKQRSGIHTFDIDDYLNGFVPRPRFDLLPSSISHWFGYRAPPKDQSGGPSKAIAPSVLLVWLFTFIGAFSGIAIIENVFRHLPLYDSHPAPIFASFGAAAILEYNAIESPLSQPRNLILGHFASVVIGVSMSKLFQMLPPDRYLDLQWLAGALAVAISGTFMSMTKTVHPPAGATALLAVTSPQVIALGWWALPLVLLAASLMLVSAMLVNNLYKRFPIYWWTPVDLNKRTQPPIEKVKDVEKAETASSILSSSDAGLQQNALPTGRALSESTTSTKFRDEDLNAMARKMTQDSHSESKAALHIDGGRIIVPDWFKLSQWETEVLEGFQVRLRSEAGRQNF